jgi:hypothetical protein
VFVNVALHPAVQPGGALLRTSVMATHDHAVLDRALDVFSEVKAAFEAEHGPAVLTERFITPMGGAPFSQLVAQRREHEMFAPSARFARVGVDPSPRAA